MNNKVAVLLVAQFLSAFADNAILFTVIALLLQSAQLAGWYVPAMQSVFLLSYVLLAPWVGSLADNYPKSQVLIAANIIKAGGAVLLLVGVEPLLAYALVGAGAALYSPAKYGVLPELVDFNSLVKANSWMEGATIAAILSGTVLGAALADYSLQLAFASAILLFAASAALTLFIPTTARHKQAKPVKIALFFQQIRQFAATDKPRFAIASASLFWATAAVVRIILIAWAPVALLSQNASDIAQLTLFLALGIIAGSAVTTRLIPIHQLHRIQFPGYAIGLLIILLSLTSSPIAAQATLFAIGCAGGIFIVPINALLQGLGSQTIGAGQAVAMQNFFQNTAMLLALAIYTTASLLNTPPLIFTTISLQFLGATLITLVFLLSKIARTKVSSET